MSKFSKWLSYTLIFIVWALVMFFPYFAFNLATQGQYTIGNSEKTHVRAFLLSEKDVRGIGWNTSRQTADNFCTRERTLFTLWEGEGESTPLYCACDDGILRVPEGNMCVLPEP